MQQATVETVAFCDCTNEQLESGRRCEQSACPNQQIVSGTTSNATFGVSVDRTCVVEREFWHNGEGWYQLRDLVTDEQFESPDIFWSV